MRGCRALLWLVVVGNGTALADPSPRTLRMRPRRVAQEIPPDGPLPDAKPDTPPPPPPPAPDTSVGARAQEAQVTDTPNLTDEQLAAMAEQEATEGEEIITVTGSLVGRKELTTS